MRQQEVLTEGAIGTKAAFEGLVANMGQLVVQQCFLVLTNKLAELTLESGGDLKKGSSKTQEFLPSPQTSSGDLLPRPWASSGDIPAVGNSLDVCEQVHLEGVALLKGLSTLRVGKVELDGDGPEQVLPLVTALPGSPTLSHMCGFSVL